MKILIYIYLVSFSFLTFAQQNFYVYNVDGTVKKLLADGKNINLNKFDVVNEKNIIIIYEGGEIILVDSSINFIKINKVGKFLISDLLKTSTFNITLGLTRLYSNIWYHELFKSENRQSGIAGVIRNSESDTCQYLLYPNNNQKTSNMKIIFRWRNFKHSENYIISLYSYYGDSIFSTLTLDTFIELDLSDLISDSFGKYYWNVKFKHENCSIQTPFSFELISKIFQSKLIDNITNNKLNNKLDTEFNIIDELCVEGLIEEANNRFIILKNKLGTDKGIIFSYQIFLKRFNILE